ncbi:hypothetical protein KUTeg_002045 [Tegillarca granosa]|uniref:Selenocysteine lyase n=1 Tax=Tegillarca granosa TaxID=220873 RepID=A0ABQ9FXL5_TEGGR|nr:hypothetical protein KUTeg_002045 [Tegillarca granosa]
MDYNATTPVDSEVLGAITASLTGAWGNPSSSHEAGLAAKSIIDEARENVARMVGAKTSDIVFTSGGTEYFHKSHDRQNGVDFSKGDNTDSLPHFITSNLEHDSVKLVLEHFAEEGLAKVSFVPASQTTGCVEVEDIVSSIRPTTCMITVMLANNETGVIQPIKEICERVQQINANRRNQPPILLHTDAAQAIGKINVDVLDLDVDYLTIVGHKFYAPRNGAIYVRNLEEKGAPLYPMLYGGGQERNYRPGTENTAMIAGLGKAAELVVQNLDKYQKHMEEVRDHLEVRLMEEFGDNIHFNGKFDTSSRLPNTCDKVLSKCNIVQASVGAACHSQNRASPILLAIGVPDSIARNALRLSVGRETTLSDIDFVISDLKQAVQYLQNQAT